MPARRRQRRGFDFALVTRHRGGREQRNRSGSSLFFSFFEGTSPPYCTTTTVVGSFVLDDRGPLPCSRCACTSSCTDVCLILCQLWLRKSWYQCLRYVASVFLLLWSPRCLWWKKLGRQKSLFNTTAAREVGAFFTSATGSFS